MIRFFYSSIFMSILALGISCSNSGGSTTIPCSNNKECTARNVDTCTNSVCVCGTDANAKACKSGEEECLAGVCTKTRLLFSTSKTFTLGSAFSTSTATSTIKSAADADAACNWVADLGGIKGNFAAWISTSTASALERIKNKTGSQDVLPITNTKAEKVATTMTNLADSATVLSVAILNENSAAATGYVFTGATNSTALGSSNCNDWSVTTGNDYVGTAGFTTANIWFNNVTGGGAATALCATAASLYCIRVDDDAKSYNQDDQQE